MTALFYASAAVAVLTGVLVITRRNYIHALGSLVLTFLAVAGMLFSLGASFAAALQIVINAGAIMVLFVFSVMMLNLGPVQDLRERQWLGGLIWLVPLLLVLLLLALSLHLLLHPTGELPGTVRSPLPARQVGHRLFSDYVLLVELASLLAGLVAAFHFGHKLHEPDEPQQVVPPQEQPAGERPGPDEPAASTAPLEEAR